MEILAGISILNGVIIIWVLTIIYIICRKSLSKESEVELLDLIHLLMTDDNVKFAQLLRTALVDKVIVVVVDGGGVNVVCYCWWWWRLRGMLLLLLPW